MNATWSHTWYIGHVCLKDSRNDVKSSQGLICAVFPACFMLIYVAFLCLNCIWFCSVVCSIIVLYQKEQDFLCSWNERVWCTMMMNWNMHDDYLPLWYKKRETKIDHKRIRHGCDIKDVIWLIDVRLHLCFYDGIKNMTIKMTNITPMFGISNVRLKCTNVQILCCSVVSQHLKKSSAFNFNFRFFNYNFLNKSLIPIYGH